MRRRCRYGITKRLLKGGGARLPRVGAIWQQVQSGISPEAIEVFDGKGSVCGYARPVSSSLREYVISTVGVETPVTVLGERKL